MTFTKDGFQGNPLIKGAGAQFQFTEQMVKEYHQCMIDPVYFCKKYVKIVHIDRGLIPFDLYSYQEKMIQTAYENRFMICKLPRQCGKSLKLDTPIATPDGWSTIGDIQIGDIIYGTEGQEIEVLGKSPVWDDHDCYNVTFDNGDTIVADAEHLWEVYSSHWTKDGGCKILETQQLIEYVNRKRGSGRPYIQLPDPVQYSEKEYTIHPYILGMWLGDGRSSAGQITCHIDDLRIYESKVQSLNESILSKSFDKRNVNTWNFTIKDLTTRLRELGVQHNKHIPMSYMRGSIEQRMDLVRGLMDTDGWSRPNNNGYEFYQKSKEFCEQFRELLASLGIKSRLRKKIVNGDKYHVVSFATDKEVCFLPRKKKIGTGEQRPEQSKLYITNIEKVDSVPVQCISVDSKNSLFLAGKGYIPTHNTVSIGAGVVLHHALFQKDKKVAILANKGDMAKKILADIKKSFQNLPKWLQQGVVEWNKTSVEFENGSKIIVSATSSDAARGDSYSLIVLDEFAFIGENQAEEFFKSVYPTISSGTDSKMVIVSTPNGINHFYRMWTEAIEKRSEFIPIEINWWDTPGRDDAWKEQQIRNTSQRDFDQEFGCIHPETKITVRHKETGNIETMRIIDFYDICCV